MNMYKNLATTEYFIIYLDFSFFLVLQLIFYNKITNLQKSLKVLLINISAWYSIKLQ